MLVILFIINAAIALATLIAMSGALRKSVLSDAHHQVIRSDINVYGIIYAAVFALFFVLGAMRDAPDMKPELLTYVYVCVTALFAIISIGMATSARRHAAKALGQS
jgi:hypothetical protein